MLAAAAANLVLSLVLTPELGLEGPALGTAMPVLRWPSRCCCGWACARRGPRLGEVLGRAWLPALRARRRAGAGRWCWRVWRSTPTRLPLVLGLALAGLLLYWLAFYRLVLDPAEREFARGFLRQSLSSASGGAPRSRSETISSSPAGHSMPTSGSSKRKPDSRAGS